MQMQFLTLTTSSAKAQNKKQPELQKRKALLQLQPATKIPFPESTTQRTKQQYYF